MAEEREVVRKRNGVIGVLSGGGILTAMLSLVNTLPLPPAYEAVMIGLGVFSFTAFIIALVKSHSR